LRFVLIKGLPLLVMHWIVKKIRLKKKKIKMLFLLRKISKKRK